MCAHLIVCDCLVSATQGQKSSSAAQVAHGQSPLVARNDAVVIDARVAHGQSRQKCLSLRFSSFGGRAKTFLVANENCSCVGNIQHIILPWNQWYMPPSLESMVYAKPLDARQRQSLSRIEQ